MASKLDRSSADKLARGLGWFSIALGVGEFMAARSLTRSLGNEQQAGIIRTYGLREIATGLGILTQSDRRPWLWGRVGGDVLDLATMAAGLNRDNAGRLGTAVAMVAGVTLLDVLCARSVDLPSAEPAFDYSDRRGFPKPPEQMAYWQGAQGPQGYAAGVGL